MRFAYADPPYPGLSRRYYADHPDYAGEVDHQELVSRLEAFDGWALSTSVEALPMVLSLLAGVDVSVAAWFRGARRGPSNRPLRGWEPVVFAGGRQVLDVSRPGRVDALVHVARPRLTDPDRVVGAKPAAFAYWMFDLLGAEVGDTLDDLFPGSGGIRRAWDLFQASAPADDDASFTQRDDASEEYSHDASRAARRDPSPEASGDVSRLPRGGGSDPSPPGGCDAFPTAPSDASILPRGDASCRSSATGPS